MADAAYSGKRYCLNVTLKVKVDRRDEFLSCIKGNEVGTLTQEPLALMYVSLTRKNVCACNCHALFLDTRNMANRFNHGYCCAHVHGLANRYQWGESEIEPNTFHFQEAYKGKIGFEAHTQAPHFSVWESFAATDPFTAEPEVFFFETA
jgi:quinol monooxygenase YgiN